ncbi:MAG: hypothetical protein LBD21_05090 [Tannerellaceae bacterium]|nr:hypothetical protein [Tannerellaceae bacterium]
MAHYILKKHPQDLAEGHIRCKPATAPDFRRRWKFATPNFLQEAVASFQKFKTIFGKVLKAGKS